MGVAHPLVESAPDIPDIGAAGAHYLLHDPTWVARHVETVEIESEYSGIRRLTVDVTLPEARETILGVRDGQALFYVPFLLLAKRPLISQFDVRDESGDALPLLTRTENAWISSMALTAALARNGVAITPEIEDDAASLVFSDPDEPGQLTQQLTAAILIDALTPGPGEERVARAIRDLAVCSMLWLPLWGVPGARRLAKLSYAVGRGRAPLLLRARAVEHRTVPLDDGAEVTFPVESARGPIRWGATLRHRRARAASWLGWSAMDLAVSDPDVRGAHTYHLQVVAPEGAELTGIALRDRDSGTDLLGTHRDSRCDGRRAHLYLPDAERTADRVEAYVRVRAERRGFLNLSLIATLVTAGGLWLARAGVEAAQAQSVNQISAAVLLVLPALLVVFVNRQGEHPIVTWLLSGVRSLVLLAGLASVAAAAALSGIRPGFWESVAETWTWCATVASFAAVFVVIAWLRSFGGRPAASTDTDRPSA